MRTCPARTLENSSFFRKKKCYNPAEKLLVFENTHEAIIDADTWARVQELRKNKRRPTRTGKTNMFSDIVRCADCGEKLHYCTSKNFEARQDHFVCSASRLKGREVCPTHYICAVVLEQGVLAHLRLVISCIANHEEQFRKAMGRNRKPKRRKNLRQSGDRRHKRNAVLKNLTDFSKIFTKITPMGNYLTADFKCSLTITNRSRKNFGKSCCN